MSVSSSPSRSTDEASIRLLYQQLMDGWNSGSCEVFATPFAENGDLIGFDGTHLKVINNFLILMSKEAVSLDGSGMFDF